MQAVRDCYTDIALMRERGLSWADISDVLARLGVTARDDQPISAVTLRSAFFLVGNQMRGGGEDDDGAESPTAPETLEAVHRAAIAVGRPGPDGPPAPDPAVTAPPSPPRPAEVPPAESAQTEAKPFDPTPAEPTPAEPRPAAPSLLSRESVIPQPAEPFPSPAPSPAPAKEPAAEAASPPALGPTPEPAAERIAAPAPEPASEPPRKPAPAPEAFTLFSRPAVAPAAPEAPSPAFQRPDPAERAAAAAPLSASPRTTPSIHSKGDRMLGTIFVLNDRGGVGKTLLSHHLMSTSMLEGLQLRVVEYEVNERLARLFGPEVVEHRKISQDFMNLMGSGDGFYEFWDQIGPELQRGGRLYDFGGNISQWFFNWAEVSGFDYYVGDGERLTFMVPVTVDLASLQTGMATLERIATIAPKAKRVLVENGFSGPFSQLEESQYARRKAEMMEREGLHVIEMQPCTAPAWARLTGHRLDQVAAMTREDLVKLGMTPPVASRSLIIIHEWLRNLRQTLAPYIVDAFRQSPGSIGKPAPTARPGGA